MKCGYDNNPKIKQVIKVIWRKSHRIWREIGTIHVSWVPRSLHSKQDLDPFSRICTRNRRDRQTTLRCSRYKIYKLKLKLQHNFLPISCIRCGLKWEFFIWHEIAPGFGTVSRRDPVYAQALRYRHCVACVSAHESDPKCT